MKRTIVNKLAETLALVAFAALALGAAPAAKANDRGCSNGSLWGTYAYTGTGSIVAPAPPEIQGLIAEVGTQSFDGRGNTTATAIISGNGQIVPLTITGTYTVNGDCTGTMTLQVSPFDATVHVSFVLDHSGAGFQAIETDAGDVITRIGRRQYPFGDSRQ